MKKVISVILSVTILLTMLVVVPFSASAKENDFAVTGATSGTTGKCSWRISGTELTISGKGEMGDYDYDNKSPWGINITKVIINNGVTTIGNHAFFGCSNLTNVTIPDSVTSIGENAFVLCTKLKSVTIPVSVTDIGESAFSICTGLTSVTIPNSVTTIGCSAFFNCSNLTSVLISDSVKSIEDCAFFGCKKLKTVTIPASVTFIGSEAFGYYIVDDDFENEYVVSDFTIHGFSRSAAEQYAKENGFTFVSEGLASLSGTTGDCIWKIDGTVLTISGNGRMDSYENWDGYYIAPWQDAGITEVVIEDGVTIIGKCAFQNCTSLKKVTLPNSIKGIGISAFDYCFNLSSISIPDSVSIIGNNAFYYCQSLTNVVIPNSISNIGDEVFAGCINLSNVIIPNSVTSIGNEAFIYCKSLTNVNTPASVTSIGNKAFYGCESLKDITIPISVKSIGNDVFGYYDDYDFGSRIKVSGFTIHGYIGSTAEKYARDNGFTFIPLDEPPVTIVLGDADDDGIVTIVDATAIQRTLAELPTNAYNPAAADVDKDGAVTIVDATAIQRWIAELDTTAKGISEPIG